MKCWCIVATAAALGLTATGSLRAQMGGDMFRKPSFTKVFNPVVGKGAQYETTNRNSKDGKPKTMEMSIVGKESVEGRDGYWFEFVELDGKGQTVVGKALLTKDDFEFHRMIVQPAGGEAMEMPFNPSSKRREKMEENLNEWHSLGTQVVTVPAGTFSCEHWRNDKRDSDVWTSEKVTPFGMVKEVSKDDTIVLSKVLSDMHDRITGPVKKFDPQEMMRQMQQQHQKP